MKRNTTFAFLAMKVILSGDEVKLVEPRVFRQQVLAEKHVEDSIKAEEVYLINEIRVTRDSL